MCGQRSRLPFSVPSAFSVVKKSVEICVHLWTKNNMWAHITLPITLDQLLTMCVGVGMHEGGGHMVGLVSNKYLGGVGDHNPGNDSSYFMNVGVNTFWDYRLELHGQRKFNDLNTRYLQWLLLMSE